MSVRKSHHNEERNVQIDSPSDSDSDSDGSEVAATASSMRTNHALEWWEGHLEY